MTGAKTIIGGLSSATFTIRGIKPLLMHNPTSMDGSDAPKSRAQRKPLPEDEARTGAYWNPDGSGTLVFPAIAVRSAILTASIGHKIGRRSAKSVLAGAIFDVTNPHGGEWLSLTDLEGRPLRDYTIDSRRAKIQSAGIVRSRPRLDEWQTRVTITFDPEFVNENEMEAFLGRAGIMVGIGDWRPACNGPMGRFEVLAGQ